MRAPATIASLTAVEGDGDWSGSRSVTRSAATTISSDAVGAAELWPMRGPFARFGVDLALFAEEVMRRFSVDQYLGFHANPATITVIPREAVKRIDFTVVAGPPPTASPSAIG